MNRIDLIRAVATKAKYTQKVTEDILDAFMDVVKETLANGDKVGMTNFGTFEVSERIARTGRNPQTNETIELPASRTAKFKPSGAFKDLLNS